MDEAGDIIIFLNDHVTTSFNNHEKTTNGKLEDHDGTTISITIDFAVVGGMPVASGLILHDASCTGLNVVPL